MGDIVELLGGLLLISVVIWSAMTIAEKAGYNGWLALLLLSVPLVNVAVLVWFACADWPALRAARRGPPAGVPPHDG